MPHVISFKSLHKNFYMQIDKHFGLAWQFWLDFLGGNGFG
jgi:hypothetical protein